MSGEPVPCVIWPSLLLGLDGLLRLLPTQCVGGTEREHAQEAKRQWLRLISGADCNTGAAGFTCALGFSPCLALALWCAARVFQKALSSPAPAAVQMTDSGGAEPEVVLPASCSVEGGKRLPPLRHVDWLQFARTLHLELFLFVYAMSYSMRLVITQDLFLSKACLLRYGINASACRDLSDNSTVKDDVTRSASLLNLALFLVQLLPAGLLSIFVSPWSDRYGHKGPLLAAAAGGLLQDLLTAGTAASLRAPPYLTVLCALPNSLSGGLVSVCAAVYGSGTRTATAELKTVRFACIMTALTLGFQLGLFAGGQVFRADGGDYVPVYLTSAALLLSMLAWVAWTVPFSAQLRRTSSRELVRDLMRLDNLRAGGRAVFRPRPGFNRAKLLLLMVSVWLILFNSETARSINYYYTKKRFNWTAVKFASVTALFGLVQLGATAACVLLFSRLLQAPDLALAALGVAAFALQNALKGLATREWMYYLSYVLGSPGGAAGIGILSYASSLINPHEATRVFSFWTTCESLVPAFGDVFSSLVFNAALSSQPGLPFLIGAALQLFPLAALLCCMRLPHADPEEEEEDPDDMLWPDGENSVNQPPHSL